MQPLVSVIIPTYNRAGLLKKSIQSVLSQTVSDFEIIVINNCSTDDTLEVIRQFNDPRIKIINFRNGGVIARSRNQGLMHSSGRYIAFLDDDDLWCPEKLELQIKYLDSHPEFDVVYSNAAIIDENGDRKGSFLRRGQAKQGKIFRELLCGNFITILTVLMKREVFESSGLLNEDPSMTAAEDYEYWLRAALRFDFGYMDKPLAMYRMHSAGMSKARSVALLRQKVLRKFLDERIAPENYHAEIIRNIERLDFSASVYHWSISDKLSAKRYAKRYIFSGMKGIRLQNALLGGMLYIIINLNYGLYRGFVNAYESKIAKII